MTGKVDPNVALSIRAIVTDVDGVLTDGKIIFDDNGTESKQFNVKDGLIIKHLRRAGFQTGVITGRDSEVVKRRCRELKFDFHRHGVEDKLSVMKEELSKLELSFDQVIYIGDDINDLELITKCAVGICPSDAPAYIRERADMVTDKPGGEGVFREVADWLLKENNEFDKLLEVE